MAWKGNSFEEGRKASRAPYYLEEDLVVVRGALAAWRWERGSANAVGLLFPGVMQKKSVSGRSTAEQRKVLESG